MTIPTISFPPSNLKTDLGFFEDEFEFEFSFPLPTAKDDSDPELQFLTNLPLVGGGTKTPWTSIPGEGRAGEAGLDESPNFLPNFILGMK